MEIGFIGAGQMAQALATGIASQLANAGSPNSNQVEFWICDPNPQAIESFRQRVNELATVNQAATNAEVILKSQIVFVAVKPQYLTQAMEDVRQAVELNPSTLLISIVAGVTIRELQKLTGAKQVIRTMPNTPCLIGKGAIGYSASPLVGQEQLATSVDLLTSVGRVHQVAEANIDAVTGLSGSGPAYVFTFIEALTDGGVLNGLPRDVAADLALQTVLGAAELAIQTKEHPAILRDRVTSPGGTTIAGLKALEETGFRDSIMSAVSAATERSIELGG